MNISARNQIKGIVTNIVSGAINDEVVIDLGHGEILTSVITKNSVKTLDLSIGKEAIAIIKAPLVILANPEHGLKFSARNQFKGKIDKIQTGSVNSIISCVTDKGTKISAVVTNDSVDDMELKVGGAIIAIVKASHVIIAVKA